LVQGMEEWQRRPSAHSGEPDKRKVVRSSLSPRIQAGVRNKQAVRLVEESRLSGCLIRIAKVAKPNANKAKALLWTQLNSLP
jgi:hypothetical protein